MGKHFTLLALAAAALAACQQDRGVTSPAPAIAASRLAVPDDADGSGGPRAVYTITNQVSGNAVAVFARGSTGTLTATGTFATGGTGTGTGLGSQGSVILSADGLRLLVVNTGSNDVSVFNVTGTGLSLASRTPSGGVQPISLTTHGDVVYALNAGGAGNITGFRLDRTGGLQPIPGSTRSLSGAATNPAQVSFSDNGRQLVVTEKGTNLLDVYGVDEAGIVNERRSFPSAGGTPFGFAFGPQNLLFVSEAAAPGSASSYFLSGRGNLRVVSGAVLTHQGAPCWAVVTSDGRFGYTGNGSGSISGFAIASDNSISLLDASGATALIGGGVNDIALSANSRDLYVLQVGDAPAIHAFRVQEDGHLTPLGPVAGLPAGTRGLAAR
jgi:6-phosphogluconolactonase